MPAVGSQGGGLNPDLPYGGQGPTQSSHYLLSKEVGFVNGVETGTQALICDAGLLTSLLKLYHMTVPNFLSDSNGSTGGKTGNWKAVLA